MLCVACARGPRRLRLPIKVAVATFQRVTLSERAEADSADLGVLDECAQPRRAHDKAPRPNRAPRAIVVVWHPPLLLVRLPCCLEFRHNPADLLRQNFLQMEKAERLEEGLLLLAQQAGWDLAACPP
jgi:hypothetical protein